MNYSSIFKSISLYEHYKEVTYPIVYYINLEHRQDRKNHLLQQLKEMDYPKDRIIRINAIKHEFGGLGCTRSHIKTLEQFIQSREEICIILEDDFTFFPNTYESFHNIIVNQNELPHDWDIIMLSSNTLQEVNHSEFFTKCINAQTASGYMVHINFAQKLINNFKEGESLLSQTLISRYNEYGLDQYWKKLQPSSNWYICKPKLGYQLENTYSDIEKKIVSYHV